MAGPERKYKLLEKKVFVSKFRLLGGKNWHLGAKIVTLAGKNTPRCENHHKILEYKVLSKFTCRKPERPVL